MSVLNDDEAVAFALACSRCGRELLDRPAFREKPLCLKCRVITGATLNPQYETVTPKPEPENVETKRQKRKKVKK